MTNPRDKTASKRKHSHKDNEVIASRKAWSEFFKRTVEMVGVAEGVVDPGIKGQAEKDMEFGIPLKDKTCLQYDFQIGLDIKDIRSLK